MFMRRLAFVLACVASSFVQAHKSNPIEKALQLISNLQKMIVTQAGDAQRTYNKYASYCEERSRSLMYEIKTEKADISKLKAAIYSSTASLGVLNAKIEDLSSEISSSEGELETAAAMREKEAAAFVTEQSNLQIVIESLKRAISVFSKKEGIALLQTSNSNSVAEALEALVEASAMTAQDAFKLSALVQEQQHASSKSDTADDDADAAIDSYNQPSTGTGLRSGAASSSSGAQPLPGPPSADAEEEQWPPPVPPAVTPPPLVPGNRMRSTPAVPPAGMQPFPPDPNQPPYGEEEDNNQWQALPPPPDPNQPPPDPNQPQHDPLLHSHPFPDPNAGDEEEQWPPPVPPAGTPPQEQYGERMALPASDMQPPGGTQPFPPDPNQPPYGHEEDPNQPPYGHEEEDPYAHESPPMAESYDEHHAGAEHGGNPLSQGGHSSPSPVPDMEMYSSMDSGPSPSPTPSPSHVPSHVPSDVPSHVPSRPVGPPPDIPEPRAAAYGKSSGGIVGTLDSLLDKAEAHLETLQGSEGTAVNNFKMVKSSLLEGIQASKKDMLEAKSSLQEKKEDKSVAGGDLEATGKDLAGDKSSKEALHHECLSAAQEFQAAVSDRKEEIHALAAAKKAIRDTTGGAASQAYLAQTSEVSFAQKSSLTQHSGKFQAVHFIRDLAAELGSASLARLARQMSSAVQLETTSDPFGKVKDLIANMILQLQSDGDGDAALKVYCDKELSETADKVDDISTDKDRLHTHIEQKTARAAKLRGDITTLQEELGALAQAQAVASKMRTDEKRLSRRNQAEMERGLTGIKIALKVLKEHYGQDAADLNLLTEGASGGIIGMLEVVESDFSKGLAELIGAEEAAATYYESEVKPTSEVEAAAKNHDLKLKQKEYANIGKAGADLTNDASHVADKLSAMHQYEATLKSKCSKPDNYTERKERREKELAGLREALTSLAGETVLFQTDSTRHLRGARRHTP